MTFFVRSGGMTLSTGVTLSALSALLVLTVTSGCGPSVTPRSDGGVDPVDAGPPPPIPSVDPVPDRVPYPLATLEGRAPEARRVLVEGGLNPFTSAVLPDETFCIDVPMPNPMSYSFTVRSQNRTGIFSDRTTPIGIEFDPGAQPVPGVTCSGADPAGCLGGVEICGNGVDDDCNGLRDDFDPACTDCVDDIFEPNQSADAPRVDPDRYEGLVMCSGDDDYYGLFARAGDTINATIFFSHADGDLDLTLFAPGGSSVVGTSASMDDDEAITVVAGQTGEYEVMVTGVGGAMATYTLDVDVDSP